MKLHELEGSFKRTGCAPLYLVLGEEDYLREQALRAIGRAALSDENGGDFNCDVYYGDECAASDILSAAKDLPVFAERRLVIVKAAEKLPARETDRLIPYLQDPNASTTVIFSASKLDGRLKFTQALKQKAAVIDCGPLPPGQMPAWVRAQATQIGLRLSDDAVPLLADLAGRSLSLITREMEKLVLSVPPEKTAGPAEVEAVRGTQPGASVFDLSAAIGAGDRARALRILARNLEAGEAPLRILGALVWQYRRLWKAQSLLSMKGADGEVGRALGVPPFRLKEFVAQARLFSEPHFRLAFQLFLDADSALKGGRATSSDRILEVLLLRLCTEDREPAPAGPTRDERTAPRGQPPTAGKSKRISNVRTIRPGRTLSS